MLNLCEIIVFVKKTIINRVDYYRVNPSPRNKYGSFSNHSQVLLFQRGFPSDFYKKYWKFYFFFLYLSVGE